MKHTPGPWFLDTCNDGSMLIQPREGFSICSVTPRDGFEQDVPNFTLMAAAPELFEALKMAVRYLEHPDVLAVTNQMAMPGSVIVERTRAAIARAEGRA